MKQKLVDEINKQIEYEFFSAHLYLAMAAYCAQNDLLGFENWFLTQVEEERYHAMKFFNYLHERDCKAVITGFDNPTTEYGSLLNVFESGLEHEKFVTSRINLLMDIAVEEKDYAAISFLNWYIDEQIEEEDSFKAMIGKIKLVGEKGPGMYQLDKEAAARTFTPPVEDK